MWQLAAGVAVLAYCLWALESGGARSTALLPWRQLSMVAFTLAVLRYAVFADRGAAGEPEDVVLRDRPLAVIGVALAARCTGSPWSTGERRGRPAAHRRAGARAPTRRGARRPVARPRPAAAPGAARELVGFAAAGAAAYAADLGLFVWLRGPGGLGAAHRQGAVVPGRLHRRLRSATRSAPTAAAARGGRARRYGVFFAVNLAGALVQLLCLAVSHYVLGCTSPRADIVSGAGVGMALATAVRFWGTRTLVFRARDRPGGLAAAVGVRTAAGG